MANVPRISQRIGQVVHYGGPSSPPDWFVVNFDHDGLLVSQSHFRLPNGAWSGGGPLFVEHISCKHEGRRDLSSYRLWGNELGPLTFTGVGDPLVYRPPGVDAKSVPSTSRGVAVDSLVALQGANYTRGILATRPGRPDSNFGQFLAELHDVPKIPGAAFLGALKGHSLAAIARGFRGQMLEFFGASASELLNWEFGWRPFLSDLRAFKKLTQGLNDRLATLIRENGKPLRRGAKLGSSRTSDRFVDVQVNAPLYNVGGGTVVVGNGATHLTATRITTEDRWFVAGYRYWINDTTSWLWKGKAAAALYGVLPTPELLWEITPWSWLIDWCEDVGDIAALYSPTAVDNLVTLYAFTMRHKVTTTTWEATTHLDAVSLPLHKWDAIPQTAFRSVYRVETKERGSGWAPFGSGLPAPTLSGRQQTILAALGISRVSTFGF